MLKIVFLAISWYFTKDVVCQDFTDNYFTVSLDHFDPTNNKTFQIRYLASDTYFNQDEKSVVFLLLINDYISEEWMSNNLTWIHYAQKFGALALQIEHRFYGNSSPTTEHTLEYLRYLTVEQELEDIAFFIEEFNKNFTFTHTPQWILIGGSYAGALASWAKYKYPHLITGAVCSSPVFLARISNPEFFDTVAADIKEVSQECLKVIDEGFRQLQDLAQNQSGREFLQNTAFDLCQKITDVYDNEENPEDFLALLIHTLGRDFADIAQFNKANRRDYSEERKSYTLDKMCTNFVTNSTNANKLAVIRLAEHYKYFNNQSCLDFNYTDNNEYYKKLDNPVDRPAQWQSCSQIGISTDRVNGTAGTAFGTIPKADWWVKQCSQIFGEDVLPAARQEALYNRTNLIYGGIGMGDNLFNTVHIQGSYDPWHQLGILKSNNPDFTVIFINGTAHCADMYAPRAIDPPELTKARIQIEQLISSWIS